MPSCEAGNYLFSFASGYEGKIKKNLLGAFGASALRARNNYFLNFSSYAERSAIRLKGIKKN